MYIIGQWAVKEREVNRSEQGLVREYCDACDESYGCVPTQNL
jgi:hypothetical protein